MPRARDFSGGPPRSRTTAGVFGLLGVSLTTAAFEVIRGRAAIWPPLAATAIGAGLTGLLLWYASRPRSGPRLPRGYAIRAARSHDLARLPDIERAAAAAFARYLPETGLTVAAMAEASTVDELELAMTGGRLWVATHKDGPVGFASVHIVAGYAHLEEVDVHPSHAGRGLGRALIETVCDWAVSTERRGVTLTTFRDVPWNAPFYERLGFIPVDPATLSPDHVEIVRDEALRGYASARRVTMVRRVEQEATFRNHRDD